jgi:hypothetical protein
MRKKYDHENTEKEGINKSEDKERKRERKKAHTKF